MDFPTRPTTHIKERKAVNLVTSHLPDEWIVREITERDYGIDLYVEIIGPDHRVTGNLIALQVKGTDKLLFSADGSCRFDGIKVSTYRYWCNLPVVVFLVVADLSSGIPYWLNIKAAARRITVKEGQETLSFPLHQSCCLDAAGLLTFQTSYLREKRWPAISKAILDALTSYPTLGPLYLYCKRKPAHLAASSTIHYMLLRHYENFSLLFRYLANEVPLGLPVWYDKHLDYIKCHHAEATLTFYYATILEMFGYFIDNYLTLIEQTYAVVTADEQNHWMRESPYLVSHLLAQPPVLNREDWYARYYFDEYENETGDISRCLFEDLQL